MNYHVDTHDFEDDQEKLNTILENQFFISKKLHEKIAKLGPRPDLVEQSLKVDKQIAYIIQVKGSVIKSANIEKRLKNLEKTHQE